MDYLQMLTTSHVAPLVGAWIEIGIRRTTGGNNTVAPLVGAWIEIPGHFGLVSAFLSLPSWERGLKYQLKSSIKLCNMMVAPLVGAWIEILFVYGTPITQDVSLPSWERGLK